MTASDIFNKSFKTLKRNSPEILTGLGVAGVVSTAYLTARASFKANTRLWIKFSCPDDHGDMQLPSNKDKVMEVWKFYIPPVLSGSATIACIIGASKGH